MNGEAIVQRLRWRCRRGTRELDALFGDWLERCYPGADAAARQAFAELLDERSDIKLFMKLPPKFKIPTPVGDYNPDWAVLKQEDGEERIYMIRETKSTEDEVKRRPTENAKIKSAKKHFEAIGVGDYAVSTPSNWRL